ncbi:hypothetical protein V8D89_002266 [Ganoderma adspersum]
MASQQTTNPNPNPNPNAGAASGSIALPELRAIAVESLDPADVPALRIKTDDDVRAWKLTRGYQDYGLFLRRLAESVVGRMLPHDVPNPDQGVITLLDKLDGWIDEIPPLQTPQRFGNLAFRSWGKRLEEESTALLRALLPERLRAAVPFIEPYWLTSFGSFVRMDYGTGHETSFALFLLCLTLLRFLKPEPAVERQVVLDLFVRYLRLCWRLQDVYKLEPAGSHGVWGLDDYNFLSYVFGSAQLRDQKEIAVSAVLRPPLPPTNLYFLSIMRIHQVKSGPFHEHSSQLHSIATGVQHWHKVHSGLFKMYEAEVLGKRVVVQHIPLGGLLPWDVPKTHSQPPTQAQHHSSRSVTTSAPFAQATPAPWAAAPAVTATTMYVPPPRGGRPGYGYGYASATRPPGVSAGAIVPGRMPLGPTASTASHIHDPSAAIAPEPNERRMAQLEILAATSPVDFDYDILSCSPTLSSSLPRNEKYFANALVNGLLSPSIVHSHDTSTGYTLKNSDRHYDDEVSIPGLPPLHRGHMDVHLRNGVMNAIHLGADGEPDAEKAFFVADLSSVYRQHERWKKLLPDIEPFYAVKCNPDPYVLRLLAGLGTGFDCASNNEIKQVLDVGVSPGRIIFANPCKAASFIRSAARAGVDVMTFDNTDELHKIARVHPSAKLVVRILTDDSKSLCRLGLKFGAPLVTVPALLAKACELGLDVVGVSFHVGSGCYDSNAFADAVARARVAFDMGRQAGYAFTLLDVGGGFEDATFEATAQVLRDALERHFPARDRARDGVRLIAEPGRYFVSKAFSLAANIIARRAPPAGAGAAPAEAPTAASSLSVSPASAAPESESDSAMGSPEAGVEAEQPSVMYYINDGVYGAFNCILFDHQTPQPYVLSLNGSFHVPARVPLRASSNMGAYTVCAASQFNGFEVSRVIYTTGAGSGAAEVREALRAYHHSHQA